MNTLLCAAALVACSPFVGQKQQLPSPGPVSVIRLWPTGVLGELIGEYMTIEGVRHDGMKTGTRSLLVDTVNGKRLARPVSIWVENLELPVGKRVVLKGYENGSMAGAPPALEQARKDQGEVRGKNYAPGSQLNWQWKPYFVALAVVEPKGLQIQAMTR